MNELGLTKDTGRELGCEDWRFKYSAQVLANGMWRWSIGLKPFHQTEEQAKGYHYSESEVLDEFQAWHESHK